MEQIEEPHTKAEEDTWKTQDEPMDTKSSDFESMSKAVREHEKEIERFREAHQDLENRMNVSNSSGATPIDYLSIEEKAEMDSRSIYVGNVDYGSTASDLAAHFRECGLVNRVTILTDKFTGHPKGFAYIEFANKDSVQVAASLDESLFNGRQIKVRPKRTNRPGVSTTDRPPRGRSGRGGGRVIVRYVSANDFRSSTDFSGRRSYDNMFMRPQSKPNELIYRNVE